MSAIPSTESIGKARWTQGEDGDASVEVRIPIALPAGVRPRDLTVEIKDGAILCIRHEETRIIQWRLYAMVKDEVEWRVEDEDTMIVDIEKKSATVWSCLLDLPMKAEDPLFTSLDDINRMFLTQLPSLPPVNASPKKGSDDAEENGNGDGENKTEEEAGDDLEKLLEEAADEVVKPSEEEATHDAFVKAELENYEAESTEIMKMLAETEVKLGAEDATAESETTEATKKQHEILTEMLRLHNACRELRTQPSSLDTFLECMMLDLRKARVNVGVLAAEEEEEFQSEDEKSLSAGELMTCGLKMFEDSDIRGCLHFLRLAAIHHKHDQSIMLLYSIYSQQGSPRGAYLLLQRALDDEEPSAAANQKVGELFDGSARHFLPLFPAALYFFQRAAKLGSVNAMLSLAQLWLRGATGTSMLTEEQTEAQRSVSKYHAWLQKAIDRGCGSAYFVRGCMYIKGEHGVKRSYAEAKDNIDAAASSQPEIIRRAPQILQMLEAMRMEEEETAKAQQQEQGEDGAAGGSSGKNAVAAPKSGAVEVTPSMARLSALSRGAGASSPASSAVGAPGARSRKNFTASARRKAFWERACVGSVVLYGIYSLSFPLRIVMLPFFYSLVTPLTEAIPWLGNSNSAAVDSLF